MSLRNMHFGWLLLLLVLPVASAQQTKPSGSERVASSVISQDEQTALQALLEKYFSSYSNKDLDRHMALWSAQAPELESHRKAVQQFFAADEKITASDIRIEEAKVDGEKIRLRVSAQMSATRRYLGDDDPALGSVARVFECIRETTGWKVWLELDPVRELAASLIAATSEQERARLMEQNKYATTKNLTGALIVESEHLTGAGELAKAFHALELALPIAQQAGDQASVSSIYRRMGVNYKDQGNHKQALDYDQKSLDLAEKLGDTRLISYALFEVGDEQARLSDYVEALKNLKRSLQLSESLQADGMITTNLMGIGNVLFDQDLYLQAQSYWEKASIVDAKSGGSRSAIILTSLGTVAYYQSNHALAFKYFQEALAKAEKKGDPLLASRILGNLGATALEMGSLQEALSYSRQSLAIKQQSGTKESVIFSLLAITEIEARQKDYAAALKDCQRALDLAQELGLKLRMSEVLLSMGEVHRMRGDYASALAAHLKSLAIGNELGIERHVAQGSAAISGDYFQLGKFDQAIESAERAASIAKNLGDRITLSEADTNAGRAYRALGQTTRAREDLVAAIEAIESVRADGAAGEEEEQQFFSGQVERVIPYKEMVELLVDQGQNAEALAFSERAKSRVLLDVLQSGKLPITKAMTEAEREQEQELERRLTSLNRQMQEETSSAKADEPHLKEFREKLNQVRIERSQVQLALYAAHPELKAHRGQMQPVTLDQAAALLPMRGAVLEFLVAKQKTYLFVLTRDDTGQASLELRVYTIPIGADDLEKKAESLHRQVAEHDQNFRAAAKELFSLLLQPAQRQLAGKDALVIVPDGPLWELPFQMLQSGGHYLLEQYAIAYAPSLTVLREMMRTQSEDRLAADSQKATTLLAMADPVLGNETLARTTMVYRGAKVEPLPEARREVQELKQLYGTQRSEIYIGDQAREDRFKSEAGKFRVLHLATHGLLDNANPMYSSVLLSPGDTRTEDGLLEAREIMQMDLKADLAVLSACETARGEISPGEGVIGLSWAFFVAGTSTTVVSQWKVESRSTAELMLAFHRILQAEHATGTAPFATARALQQAALRVLHERLYSHPFYWAGFVVVGNPN